MDPLQQRKQWYRIEVHQLTKMDYPSVEKQVIQVCITFLYVAAGFILIEASKFHEVLWFWEFHILCAVHEFSNVADGLSWINGPFLWHLVILILILQIEVSKFEASILASFSS